MKRFIVWEPKDGVEFSAAGGEKLVFLREGFSWVAFLFPPLWLIYRRAWRGLLLWLVLVGLVVAAGVAGVDPGSTFWLMLLASAVIGFEAAWLRSISLRRRGFRPIGVVLAPSRIEAERQFFAGWTQEAPEEPAEAAPTARYRTPQPRWGRSQTVLGLFPEPGSSR